MRLHLRRTLVAALCVAGSGCASVPYRLEPALAAGASRVKVRTQVAQQHVSIEVLPSGYGSSSSGRLSGMVVGALIDAGVESRRSRDAERRIRPLRSVIRDLDHPARVWERLVPGLQAIDRPEVVDVLTSRDMLPVTVDDVRDSAFVSLATSYDLSPNASVLEMHTDYWFYARGSTSPAAVGSVSYWSSQIGRSPDGESWREDEEAISLWAANDGAAYRAALDEAIAETVRMLRLALPFATGRDVAASESIDVTYDVVHGRGDFGIDEGRSRFQAKVLERSAERLVLQVDGGPFYSLPAAEAWERRLP